MDISLRLDQTQSRSRFLSSLKNPTNKKLPVCDQVSLKMIKGRSPVSQFRCSLRDQGLRPRPMPKPLKKEQTILKKNEQECLNETKNSNFSSGICGQIKNYVLYKRYNEALERFEILECQNDVTNETYDALISACIGLRSIRGVKRVFGHMRNSGVDLDLNMMNRVLLMHVKCRMMIDARQLFEDMPERNFDSWNTIIGGLVDSGDYLDAFQLFLMMWEEDSCVGPKSLTKMMKASAGLGLISPGQQLHSCALKMGLSFDVFVSCTLIDMYSKCGNVEYARLVFDEMPYKTTVAWNNIIAGYNHHGYSEEAISMYYKMKDWGAKMDNFTCSIVVRVCTRLASLEHAKQVHAVLVRNGFGDIVANSAFVDLYSKWGRIEDARNVFEKIPQKNVISWNALILGYGIHGCGTEAIELFERMIREGTVPNHVTFLAVLSACCYSGLFKQGCEIFESMSRDYKIKPRAMHYTCMVELLGREGFLDEAFALIRDAPFVPTINTWAALLTACRIHKNFVLGKLAAEKLYGMAPEKLSNYVVLLNIYNSSGKLQEAAEVLHTLRRKGLRLSPVCTRIEIKRQQHVFFSGDKSHPQNKEIYLRLNELMVQISKNGYVADENNMFPDMDKHEESLLLHHSEKLAVAFGLISTPSSTPLQVVQDHRICKDCHNAIKLISLVSKREIAAKDASRFHRFKDGSCSCGDYW